MKLTNALALALATVLMATAAHAASLQDVEAPRGQEVQAPREQDVQAPRDRSEDVQAPRGYEVQSPRAGCRPPGERGPSSLARGRHRKPPDRHSKNMGWLDANEYLVMEAATITGTPKQQ